MRKTVTIPAAGEQTRVDLTGISIVVEAAGVYDNVDDVPVLSFDRPGNDFPIYPRSVYQNPQGEFNNIIITGTAESAGDDLTLVSFDECLQSELNIVYTDSFRATLKDTFSITTTDVVQSIPEVNLLNSSGKLPSKIYISARSNDIAYAFGSDPDQTDEGYILTAGADPVEVNGINFILALNFISETGAAAGNLIITPEY